jgi:hypothetical protein
MWPLYIGSNGQIRKSIPFSVKVATYPLSLPPPITAPTPTKAGAGVPPACHQLLSSAVGVLACTDSLMHLGKQWRLGREVRPRRAIAPLAAPRTRCSLVQACSALHSRPPGSPHLGAELGLDLAALQAMEALNPGSVGLQGNIGKEAESEEANRASAIENARAVSAAIGHKTKTQDASSFAASLPGTPRTPWPNGAR